ncbi:hypothetical protein LOTGIDRAFT_123068, partial [Lottia gigantea]
GIILDESALDVNRAITRVIAHKNMHNADSRILLNATIDLVDVSDSYKLSEAICRQLHKGVFLLFGTSLPKTFNTIQSYSHALKVPYVVVTPNRNDQRDGYRYEISMSPSYIEVIIDLIKWFGWGKIYYLFDSDDGLWQLQKIYDSFRQPLLNLVVDARRIRNLSESHELLRRMDRSDSFSKKRIVISLSTAASYQLLLNQIVDVGMNRDDYHYLLGGPDIGQLDLKSFLHGGVNVTGFRLFRPSSQNELASILKPPKDPNKVRGKMRGRKISTDVALATDGINVILEAFKDMLVTCADDERCVFKTLRHGDLYNNDSKGIQCRSDPLRPWTHGDIIQKAITEVSIDGLTGNVSFNSQGIRRLQEVDIMHLQFERKLRRVGTWTIEGGFKTNLTRPGNERIKLEPNRTRIVTTILEPPFTVERAPVDGVPFTGNDRYEGFCIDLARMVAKKVGYEYVIKLVDDRSYGSKLQNGTWTGMIGELVRREADIAVAPLTITQARERVVDFTKPFLNTGISIMIKKPMKSKPGVFSFMSPLAKYVWVCIILGFLAVGIVLFLVGRFSPLEWVPEEDSEESNNVFTIGNTMWFALGALMQQGSDISPRSISGRIVGSAWWFFTLIIISSYTANLAAFLTIEKMVMPIESADDLVRQTEIKYGTLQSASTVQFFRETEVLVYNQMWNFMRDARPSVFVPTVDDGVRRVRSSKGKYAFILESAMNEYQNQRRPCDTIKIGRNLDSKGYGIATPLKSDLRDRINIAVLELREVGELHKLEQKWWYDKGECGDPGGKESSINALTLSNVSGIFHILIGGLVLAMLTAFLDFLFKKKFKGKKIQVMEFLIILIHTIRSGYVYDLIGVLRLLG